MRERSNYTIFELRGISNYLRRSRRVPSSLFFSEAWRRDLEGRCGRFLVTSSGVHEVGEDFCLLEKVFKPLSLILFLNLRKYMKVGII